MLTRYFADKHTQTQAKLHDCLSLMVAGDNDHKNKNKAILRSRSEKLDQYDV